jgi:hypothetical protein
MNSLKRITILLALFTLGVLNAQTTYTATWASVDKHNSAPEWFK